MANTAGGVLLALLLFLSASVPCFSVSNSGECFFNTKGAVRVCDGCVRTQAYMCVSSVTKELNTFLRYFLYFFCISQGIIFIFSLLLYCRFLTLQLKYQFLPHLSFFTVSMKIKDKEKNKNKTNRGNYYT